MWVDETEEKIKATKDIHETDRKTAERVGHRWPDSSVAKKLGVDGLA